MARLRRFLRHHSEQKIKKFLEAAGCSHDPVDGEDKVNAECPVCAKPKFSPPTHPEAALPLARRFNVLQIADFCAAGNPIKTESHRFL